MDYSSESVSYLGRCISIKDGHLSTSVYRKPTDNLMMLLFSSFHAKHVKEAISFGQALKLPKLQDNIDQKTTHPCHSNLSKTCQIINMDTTITTCQVHGRYSCDSANVVYLIRC
eukprot:g45133.t1